MKLININIYKKKSQKKKIYKLNLILPEMVNQTLKLFVRVLNHFYRKKRRSSSGLEN